jgi:putative membrane protein
MRKKGSIKLTNYWTIIMAVFALLVVTTPMYADSDKGNEHGKLIEDVLQDIRENLGLSPGEEIDPKKVSDKDFEELGEAVMSIMHPDPEEHRLMDDMMGGEGSRRLSQMHRMMGYQYLSGKSGEKYGYGGKGCGMMGKGMMGYGMMGGMMGGNWMHYSLGRISLWVLALVILGLLIYVIVRLGRRTTGVARTEAGETPLEIAKKRYARGEINREEFDKIRKDLA